MTKPARPLLRQVSAALTSASRLDASWLVGLACGQDSPVLSHQQISLTEAQKVELARLIDARNSGQPISRMLAQGTRPDIAGVEVQIKAGLTVKSCHKR